MRTAQSSATAAALSSATAGKSCSSTSSFLSLAAAPPATAARSVSPASASSFKNSVAVRPPHIWTMLVFSDTYLLHSPQHALLPGEVPLQLWPRGLAALVPEEGQIPGRNARAMG